MKNNLSKEDIEFLQYYSDSEYEKPSVTVDCVIFRLTDKPTENYRKLPQKKLQVFLTKRQYLPFKEKFSVIGTFVNLAHELSESAKLCVLKKTNLSNSYFEQLYTFGEKSRDPRTRVLSVSYLFLTNQNQTLENGEWFDIDFSVFQESNKQNTMTLTLSNKNLTLINTFEFSQNTLNDISPKTIEIQQTQLAFDHAKIIVYALMRLRNKLEYTDIIFNLLEEKFTLTQLKNAYETILNETLLDANFRRKTAKLVSPLNEYTSGFGHRTSQLFKKNKNWNKLFIE